ncbi:MAG: radical SAM protein [Candidatus Omnitrophica bacterium]|nr:radical SAM protein [Candidatus Omnitrophota bacterium]
MDKYKIDSHKLIYHVPRLNDWLQGKITYPIYMEVSPAGACNHRCKYCGLDFMEYQPRFLDEGILKERLGELSKLGLKSIMYAGEGEPFLHKSMREIINCTKKNNIDVSITTNGVLFNKEIAEKTLGDIEWIKVSINGATKETYSKIHCCKDKDYDCVIENMKYAVKIKEERGYSCTLGMQLLLLPENYQEAVHLAKLACDIGMDYLVIKPYSQHPQSKTTRYKSVKYSEYEYLSDELRKCNTDSFSVIFRIQAMKKWDDNVKKYKQCLSLPFWSYIDAGGNVWGCSVYLGDERFLYGNINEQSFQQIWEGQRRLNSLRWVESELNASECRINCRMEEVNKYLWDLKNPPAHVNFI